jgi:3-hydroxybutyryl-CoA dehydrogenase
MINKIGIIGGGKMGTDIFYFLSDFPFQLTWLFKSQMKLEKAREDWIKKQQRALKYNRLDEDAYHEKLLQIQFTSDLSTLADCDLIIESITENYETKSALFRELDVVVKPESIFSSNTSSISIASMVPSNRRINRFVGLHFFYPVKIKNLVEVNILSDTSQAVVDILSAFLLTTRKFFKILPEPDHFLFNRLFLPLQSGVYNLYEEDKIPIEILDLLVKEKLLPFGIFEFFDQVGIDVMHTAVSNYTLGKTDADFYQPLIEGLKKLKEDNHLGLKTGKGFYNYMEKKPRIDLNLSDYLDKTQRDIILKKIYSWYLSPIFEVVTNHILTRQETIYFVKEYMGLDKSPFNLAKEIGFKP